MQHAVQVLCNLTINKIQKIQKSFAKMQAFLLQGAFCANKKVCTFLSRRALPGQKNFHFFAGFLWISQNVFCNIFLHTSLCNIFQKTLLFSRNAVLKRSEVLWCILMSNLHPWLVKDEFMMELIRDALGWLRRKSEEKAVLQKRERSEKLITFTWSLKS